MKIIEEKFAASSPNSNANAVSSRKNRTEATHDPFKIQKLEFKILPPSLRPLHCETRILPRSRHVRQRTKIFN